MRIRRLSVGSEEGGNSEDQCTLTSWGLANPGATVLPKAS